MIKNNGEVDVFSTVAMLKYVVVFVEQNTSKVSVFSFPLIESLKIWIIQILL